MTPLTLLNSSVIPSNRSNDNAKAINNSTNVYANDVCVEGRGNRIVLSRVTGWTPSAVYFTIKLSEFQAERPRQQAPLLDYDTVIG